MLPVASSRHKPPFYFNNNLTAFHQYAETPQVRCPEKQYFGGMKSKAGPVDGDKAVCLAPVYNITPGDCIVYAFDPTMGVEDHRRSDKIYFYNLGVGPADLHTKLGGVNATVRTLGHIIDMLGHINKYLGFTTFDARRTPHDDLWYTTDRLPDLVFASCYELAWAQVDFPNCFEAYETPVEYKNT
ncbi:putative methyltransferase-like 4 [Homarus americanus]|uniref:Putative methyltransferase-like 4 n=1 Tax=Homarus americanus TaxID=6706 RepID=A0A8J5TK70_HOMAM|nr:putative methyltransferase-like 4 [Homarus americanus]